MLTEFIDIFLHLDKHLNIIIQTYGNWTYLILSLIIFCETGLVIAPFLPGDSLLFVAGAFAAGSSLQVGWLLIFLFIAAVLGDALNYHIGYYLGPNFVYKQNNRFIKKEYIERTHAFFEKYGVKTIIFARFVPLVRTFAPFMAGVGNMNYWRFAGYNVIGGFLWVFLFVWGGYFFGNIPAVKSNFTLVIFAIIIISFMPTIIEVIRQRRLAR